MKYSARVGSDVLCVVHFVRTDEADVAGTEAHRLPGDGQFHGAQTDQHHFFPEVLMRRVVHLARRDVALMAFHLEAGVGLAGEHAALLVLAVGGDRELIVEIRFRAEDRQFFDGVIGRRRRCGLRRRVCVDAAAANAGSRKPRSLREYFFMEGLLLAATHYTQDFSRRPAVGLRS